MKKPLLSFIAFIFIGFFGLNVFGFASTSVFNFSFDPSDIVFEKVEGYDRVKLKDGRFSAEPGNPLLPIRFAQIAIPAELEVRKVEVISFERQEFLGEYKIYPSQPLYPLSGNPAKGEDIEFSEPDPSVYQLPSEYPGELVRLINNGFLGGHHIAGVALYPLQYIPSEGKLFFYTKIEFRLDLKPSSRFPAPVKRRSRRGASFYSNLVKSLVVNPKDVQLKTKGYLPLDEEVDYLIITQSSFAAAFQDLAFWKILKGIPADIRDISWIFSNYSGDDNQEKIRNCIRDFYSNYGTRWVLLGGDTQIIPCRTARAEDEDIPSDLYFSDLDGSWDANGNQVYGEYEDSVDMYPDVFVGRAPSHSIHQAQTFVNKCLVYEKSPPTDYQTKMLYAAEEVWPGTDAAELKNYIDTSFVPDYFEVTKLYESSGNLSRTTFREALNQGQNIINHNGHGNYNRLSIGSATWFISDMDSLVNGPRYSMFYTYGCITAAIDEDCIAEHFLNNPNGGGFAYCGNTRSGWGVVGEPLEGPGAEFDIEFFHFLFDNNTYEVGKTLGNSKIPFIPMAQDPGGEGPYYRWTMFTLLLLGDPNLRLWTDIPKELSVNHDPVLFAGMDNFEVYVSEDSALICCVEDGQILGTAFSSDGSTVVYLDTPLTAAGTVDVTVTKHNYLPYHSEILVILPEGSCLFYHSHQIDDTGANNNGFINPGEIIHMPVTVRNYGIETAYGVSATLREDDDFIVVNDSVKSFGNIDPGMTAVSSGSYVFETYPLCPDSHLVNFTLEITDSETSWVSSFGELVAEPDFILAMDEDTAFVQREDSTSFKLTITSLGGFNLPVNLNHCGLPSEVSGFVEPDQLIPTDSSVFKIYTSSTATLGIYSLTITAAGGGIVREKEVMLFITPPPYYGAVWHVSGFGDDLIGNGSQEFPFRTVQKGIQSAAYGDTVLVEKGQYEESINFYGKAILLGSRFIFDGLKSTIDSTVIQWDGEGSVVTFESGEYANSVIRGFTLTGGCDNQGRVIYCYDSSPTISDNFIIGDLCGAGMGGSGIYCSQGSLARIYRNLIVNCSGPGAVVLNVGCDAELVSNTICSNATTGVYMKFSNAYIKNNIICNNANYGLHITKQGSWEVLYNNVFGQEENCYGEIEDQTGIEGNISADPLFTNPGEGDFDLTLSSPCINAGDPDDSVPFGGGDRIDMGAFECLIDGSLVIYHSHDVDDSEGNKNGVVNPGEKVFMSIFVKNSGPETAFNVNGRLITGDDFVLVSDSIKSFGDIDPGMTALSTGAFSFEVDSTCPDSHQVIFTLKITDGENLWLSSFSQIIVKSDFMMTPVPLSAFLYPDDSTSIQLIVNSFGGFNWEVDLSCQELPPGVSGVFYPEQLTPPDSSLFRIYTLPEAPLGIYTTAFIAAGDGVSHDEQVGLEIIGCGDVDGDKILNLADIIYLANYYLKGEKPPPDPISRANANGDDVINLADVIYLTNYKFKGGSPPYSCGNYSP